MVRVKIGDKYGRLLVEEYLYSDHHYRKFWKCKCDCGKNHVIHSGQMTSGNTKSCGCLRVEKLKSKRISENHSEITAIILGYKRGAKNRGYEWDLSREQVEKLIEQNCYYCDEPPSNIKTTKNSIRPYYYNGIDRTNNILGYTVENCVPCCKTCNLAKRDLTLDQFINWLKRVARQWS